jgi:hypothetical protein
MLQILPYKGPGSSPDRRFCVLGFVSAFSECGLCECVSCVSVCAVPVMSSELCVLQENRLRGPSLLIFSCLPDCGACVIPLKLILFNLRDWCR